MAGSERADSGRDPRPCPPPPPERATSQARVLLDAGAGRRLREARRAPPVERAEWATGLALRLDRPISVLGLVFVLVVLGETLATPPLRTVFAVTGWVLWAVFVAEYALRVWVAPNRGRYLRRTWWQLIFLVVPFLRFLRLVWVLRTARVGRLLSASVRGSRSAGRLLSSRLGWLSALSAVVVLTTSQLLFTTGDYPSYGRALYETALSTLTGEPLTADTGLARVLSVALAVYSLAVVATLAGSLGAWFMSPSPVVGTDGEPS